MLMNDALKYAANKAINCAKDLGEGKKTQAQMWQTSTHFKLNLL